MTDLRFTKIAFGGVAIEPLTEAGAVFVESLDAPFRIGDACLTGFPRGTVAIEPRDFGDMLEAASFDGLTWEVTA